MVRVNLWDYQLRVELLQYIFPVNCRELVIKLLYNGLIPSRRAIAKDLQHRKSDICTSTAVQLDVLLLLRNTIPYDYFRLFISCHYGVVRRTLRLAVNSNSTVIFIIFISIIIHFSRISSVSLFFLLLFFHMQTQDISQSHY